MSPTILREKGYRFFFFSREEPRMHIHIHCDDGEAKFWLKPDLELANNFGLAQHRLNQIENIIEEHFDEFTAAWEKHFGS